MVSSISFQSTVTPRDIPYDAVPKPIAGCRKRNSLGPDRKLEDFSNDDPCRRSPCRCEEEYVQAYKYDEDDIRGLRVRVGGPYSSNGEFANSHADCAPDEERPSAISFDRVEADRCRTDVNHGRDHRDQERIVHADK